MGFIVILDSWKDHFIRVDKTLVQYPSNNILIQSGNFKIKEYKRETAEIEKVKIGKGYNKIHKTKSLENVQENPISSQKNHRRCCLL